MFNNNPMSFRQEQVSEEILEPLYVPIIVGNEVYVIAQQDVRNVTDRRSISCIRCPNGLRDLQHLVLSRTQNSSMQSQPQSIPQCIQAIPQNIVELINNAALFLQQQYLQNQINAAMQARSLPPPTIVAPLQTQIDWEMRECLAEKPNQFSYGKKTSTTDLVDFNIIPDCCKQKPYSARPIVKMLISKGTNTTAEEIVDELEKQKKDAAECSSQTAQEKRKQKKVIEND